MLAGFCCCCRAFSPISIGAAAADPPVAALVRRDLPRWAARRRDRGRPRGHRSRAERMAAGARPRADRTGARTAARPPLRLAPCRRVLVPAGSAVLATPAILRGPDASQSERRVHGEHHQRRPAGAASTGAGAAAHGPGAIRQGFLVRESERAALAAARTHQPQINVSINVNAKPLSETDFEVELKLEGKAEAAGSVLFNFELVYAGVFRHPERAAGAASSR